MKITHKPEFRVKETIVVPHQGREVTFVVPEFPYRNQGEQTDNAGLLRPTFAEIVSLVYAATQNEDNEHASRILFTLKSSISNGFYGFNDIIYKPKEGAFISDRNRKNIYVPFGFKTGQQSLDDIVANPFVLALVEGEEGAEKLAGIARFLKKRPTSYVWSLTNVDSETKAVAGLYARGVFFFNNRLVVDGSSDGDDDSSNAFWVLDSGEATL